MESELIKTINSLSKSGKTIYLTDDVPEFPFNPNRCKGKRWLTSKPQICTFKSQAMNFNRDYLKIVSLNHPNVHLIQTMKYFCENNICNMTDGDKILFRDSHHLNIEGSLLLGKKMAEDNPAFIRNIMPTM